MGDFNFDELWKAVKNWPSLPSLIGLLILELGILKFVWPSTQESTFLWGICLFFIITLIIWLICRKVPRKRKKSFGFLVAIYCDDSTTEKNFREDFIKNLNAQFINLTNCNKYDFIELKPHISKNISTHENGIQVLQKSNSDFLIYGRVRTREEDNKKIHYLDINCVAIHSPVPTNVSNRLSEEMLELLPSKLIIEDSKFLESFEITSKWLESSSKYLIGHIKFLAGDYDSALDVYNEVLSKLPNSLNSVAETIRIRCYGSIVVVYETKILLNYREWVSTHDDKFLFIINSIIDEFNRHNFNSITVDRIKAILMVLINNDFSSAMLILKKIPSQQRDALWFLNCAFLNACQKDLKSAVRWYRNANQRPTELLGNNLLGDVEDFINFYLEKNPEYGHLHYCLGFINMELKQDTILAKNHFQQFIDLVPSNEFIRERELASKWLKNLAI